MNEITEAITYFEDAVRDSDEIIESCEADVQAGLSEQREHFVVALAALREQAEREKGCGHCGSDAALYQISTNGYPSSEEAIAAWNRRIYHAGDTAAMMQIEVVPAFQAEAPLTVDELRQMDGEPVYYAWDNIGWARVVVIDDHPRIAAIINHGHGYECALYAPTDIEGNSYAYRSKPKEES